MAQSHALLPMGETTGHLIDTLRALVGREFRMRYKGSFFGVLWALLTPLGLAVILQYVFTNILTIGVSHYGAFLYSAILPWTWFSVSVQTGASTLGDNRDLVRTPFFAKSLLPCAVTCTNFLFYFFALPVVCGMMAYDGLPFTGALVALPVIWVVQGILTLGFTLLVAAVGILVRDVQHLMAVVLLFWFYLTPIFYDLNQLPPESARWLLLNPMATIVTAHRAVILHGQFPDWAALGLVTAASLGILAMGLVIFRSLEDSFIDNA
jgi:lipopolysaccharide transport system permease protein